MKDGSLVLPLGDLVLQSGETLSNANMVFKTWGKLSSARDNVILIPTSFGATHQDFEWMIGEHSIFDPRQHFVVIANLFGNGLSTSPSNISAGAFPKVTQRDNAIGIRLALERHFDVSFLRMVIGWSMGGQVAFHYASLYPSDVQALIPICASAKTSPHNQVFLEGARAVLTTDSAYSPKNGWFTKPPRRALTSLARFYAGWALSQRFYREEIWRELGCVSLENFIQQYWEKPFSTKNPNNLLSHIAMWQGSNIAENEIYCGDLRAALGSIKADVCLIPCQDDLYFRVEDSRKELELLNNAELKIINSVWGHRAGNPVYSPKDQKFIRQEVHKLLA